MKASHKKPTKTSESLTPVKRRAFFIITLVFPILLFVFVELILRAVNYGPNLSLFITEVLHGKTYHIMNPEVKNRYFYRVRFSPSTSPDYFLVPKPEGTFRIFCLGGSTTVGFPYYYNVSFSSFLRDRLRRIFPDRAIEIINIGMTATNSFTTLDMARDAIDYEPDLFVVYDGHNEFYGALGVSSHESFGSSRTLSFLYLRLIHLRTFLFLRDLVTAVRSLFGDGQQVDPYATMMEKLALGHYIPLDSKEYTEGLETFKANIDALRNLCAARGIPLIVGTQVSNLRRQTPFVSEELHDAPSEQRLQFNQVYNAGLAYWMNGEIDSAFSTFTRATTLHPRHAEAHYYLARCLDTLGHKKAARREYVRARDLDELRFRTSSDFNNALRALDDGKSLACADMEAVFQSHSPDSLIGNELILEHLHPNSYGYFLMAKEYACIMKDRGILAPTSEWATHDTIPDSELWEDRHVSDIDERIAGRRTEVLTASWPFKNGITIVDAISKSDTLGLIADQVAQARLFWHQAHQEAAHLYEVRGDQADLEREYRILINQLPMVEVTPYLRLAKLLLDEKRIPEVRQLLRASLNVRPTILAYRALADIALNSGDALQAIAFYEKTFTFPQSPDEQAQNGHLLALAYLKANRPEDARARLMKVLAVKPDYKPSADLLQAISAR